MQTVGHFINKLTQICQNVNVTKGYFFFKRHLKSIFQTLNQNSLTQRPALRDKLQQCSQICFNFSPGSSLPL